MPFTLLHYVQAYATWILVKRRIPLHLLVIASMLPDLEIPIIYTLHVYGYIQVNRLFVDRLVLHSLIGGVLVTPLLLLLILPLCYRVLGLFSIRCCRTSIRTILLAGSIGGLGHVLIDSIHHWYNPLLYPFTTSSIDVFVLGGNAVIASIYIHLSFLIILLAIASYYLTKTRDLKKMLALMLDCTLESYDMNQWCYH